MSTSPFLNNTVSSDQELLIRRQKAVVRGVATATPIFAARAQNAEVWSHDGKGYVDFASGIGTLATGHCHPAVIAAVSAQMKKFTHTAFQVIAYEPYVAVAERLNAIAPFSEDAKTLLLTTGAEAVEAAVKIARVATGRPGVIAFSGAFHGRTNLGMALTGKTSPYKQGVNVSASDVLRVPFPIAHYGVDVRQSLAAIDMLFRSEMAPSRVAAVIVEPVQGEGGFHVAPQELLATLRRICDTHGIVFIADEIQSGFGRTSRYFAIEHSGVEPDLITVAKSLSGGFPLSGVVGRSRVMDAVEPGGLGGTFGGSPIGCAAAIAVMEVIEKERLLERADAIGSVVRARLDQWAERKDLRPIAHVRGLGAMLAFDLVKGRGRDEPDGDAAKEVTRRALDHGLIVLSCGVFGETIRILVPLTVADGILQKGLDALESALKP